MFVRKVQSGPRSYLRIVEGYRDKKTGKVCQRTVANLFRMDKDYEKKVKALEKFLFGEKGSNLEVEFEEALEFGDVFLLHGIWDQLKLDKAFETVLEGGKSSDHESVKLIRAMVFHRLCDPGSKLHCTEWLRNTVVPGIAGPVSHSSLLRAMDVLIDNLDNLEREFAKLLMPLLDQDLTLAMYDLTTVGVVDETELEGDVREFGKSKDTGGIGRQFVLGIVQSNEGLPLMYQVHKGNTGEHKTLLGMVESLLTRYPIRRIVTVADRGLLSQKNVESLVETASRNNQELQFILGIPARRYSELTRKLPDIPFDSEGIHEGEFMGHRLIAAFDAEIAKEQSIKRQRDIQKLRELVLEHKSKLKSRKSGKAARGRPPSKDAAVNDIKAAVRKRSLSRIVKLVADGDFFNVQIDQDYLSFAEECDGKMAVLTNVSDMPAKEILDHYKNRADIERGFRTMKSDLLIKPIHHRLPDRINGHAAICFLALLINRVMRSRLRANGTFQSPTEILGIIMYIKLMSAQVNGERFMGISQRTEEQLELFDKLEVAPPK